MKSSSRRFAFNIIDLILILVILSAATVMVYLLVRPQSDPNPNQTKAVTLDYQIKVESVRQEFQGKAGIGDLLCDSQTGVVLGEIIDITYADYMYQGINKQTGESVETPYPGYLTMTLTVRSEAKNANGFIFIDTYEMQMGKQISFHLPNLAASGYLSAMTSTETEPEMEANA